MQGTATVGIDNAAANAGRVQILNGGRQIVKALGPQEETVPQPLCPLNQADILA